MCEGGIGWRVHTAWVSMPGPLLLLLHSCSPHSKLCSCPRKSPQGCLVAHDTLYIRTFTCAFTAPTSVNNALDALHCSHKTHGRRYQ